MIEPLTSKQPALLSELKPPNPETPAASHLSPKGQSWQHQGNLKLWGKDKCKFGKIKFMLAKMTLIKIELG